MRRSMMPHDATRTDRHRLPRVATATGTAIMLWSTVGAGVHAQAPSPSGPVTGPQPVLSSTVDAALVSRGTRLGGDPERVRAYVASALTPETYEGALKGPRGAFLTGAANSVDQALLVAELLHAGGPDRGLRFASCELTVADLATPVVPPLLALDQPDALAAAITDAEVAPEVMASVTALGEHRARTRARVAAASESLERSLTASGWTEPTSAARGGTARHVWVQAEQDGSWLDVDPTTPSGAPPCAADETWSELPDPLWHTVRFRVSVEHQSNGALVETPVLETTRRTADLAASRITLGFGEPMGLVEQSAPADAPELTYTPLLRIDDTSVVGDPVRVLRPVVDEGGGGLGLDPFGGLVEPEPVVETDPVTAAWLDIETYAPDGAVRSHRSEVFDRLGPVARSSGAAAAAPVLPLDLVEGTYAALDASWHIGLLLGERRQVDGDEPAFLDLPSLDVTTIDGLAATVDALLRLYPALRRDLGGDAGTPVILLAGVSQVEGPPKRGGLAPGDVLTRLVLDALEVPASPPSDAASAARDAQATLAAERMLADLAGGDARPLGDSPAVLAAAEAAGTPWLAIRPGDTARPVGASDVALARMDTRLAGGDWLLTPATVPSVDGVTMTAWWFVDPATGVVRDEHEQGRHPALAEYGGQEAQTTSRWQSFCNLAWSLRRGFVVAAAALYLGTGGAAGGEALKAVVKIVEAQQKNQKTADEALRLACPRQSGSSGPPLP